MENGGQRSRKKLPDTENQCYQRFRRESLPILKRFVDLRPLFSKPYTSCRDGKDAESND